MIIDEIRTLEGLLAMEMEWRQLQRVAGNLPFTSFEWNVAWWSHLARKSLHVKDRLATRTLRNESGELVAVAPLMLSELPSTGPFRFRALQFLGANPNITEIRGILCRPELELDCYDALLEHLFQRSSEWDFMTWGGITEAAAARFGPYGNPFWLENIPYFVLDLPKAWEEFRSSRPRNVKESLRKCRNSLRNDGIEARFEVAERGPALERALTQLVRLHGERSQRTDTVRHANVFAVDRAVSFLHDVCDRYSAAGSVQVFSVEVEGKIVAARLGFTLGDTLYLSYSGYDSRFGKYSVMTTVVANAIKYAIENGLGSVNLSTGNDVSKTRWAPRRVETKVLMMPSHALRAPLAMTLYNSLRRRLVPPERAGAFPSTPFGGAPRSTRLTPLPWSRQPASGTAESTTPASGTPESDAPVSPSRVHRVPT